MVTGMTTSHEGSPQRVGSPSNFPGKRCWTSFFVSQHCLGLVSFQAPQLSVALMLRHERFVACVKGFPGFLPAYFYRHLGLKKIFVSSF